MGAKLPLTEIVHLIEHRIAHPLVVPGDALPEDPGRYLSQAGASPELVALGKDGRGDDRFTSRSMLETEQRLENATIKLDARRNHGVDDRHLERALAHAADRGMVLSSEQRGAFEHVTSSRGISNVIGYAGTGKSAMLGVAREAWEAAGYEVRGIALSGIAAEGLESGSGIVSRTIASLEHQWGQDRELLSSKSLLVIDEAGMIGTRQMERVMTEAEKHGAKVVLVGDPQQLQAIEAGASFRSIAERHGAVEITEVRRQHEDWQRDATQPHQVARPAPVYSFRNSFRNQFRHSSATSPFIQAKLPISAHLGMWEILTAYEKATLYRHFPPPSLNAMESQSPPHRQR